MLTELGARVLGEREVDIGARRMVRLEALHEEFEREPRRFEVAAAEVDPEQMAAK